MKWRRRQGAEQENRQRAGETPADMRLPGDAAAVGADRNRSEAENDVDAEPDAEESEHAGVAQRMGKRQRWNFRRFIRIAAAEGEEASLDEGKANGGRHGAGYRGRGADHRRDRVFMGEQ